MQVTVCHGLVVSAEVICVAEIFDFKETQK